MVSVVAVLLMVNGECVDGECGGCAVAVPLEAVGFLGAVAVFLLLLLVFALYLNKAFCFANCGGFPCIDQMPKKDANSLGKSLHGGGRGGDAKRDGRPSPRD